MQQIIELIPLIIFFTTYKLYDLIFATAALIVASLAVIIITYITTKKVPMTALVSTIILVIFGSWTILANDELFIKIKPTIVNILFALVLIVGFFNSKLLVIKKLLESAIEMDNKYWQVLSVRWAMLFCFLAILNELIWRNFSTDFWVQFKVFGMLPITIIFMLLNIPFLKKNAKFNV
ncbi:MAG: septation protein A [Pseudomonadota bacterium]